MVMVERVGGGAMVTSPSSTFFYLPCGLSGRLLQSGSVGGIVGLPSHAPEVTFWSCCILHLSRVRYTSVPPLLPRDTHSSAAYYHFPLLLDSIIGRHHAMLSFAPASN